MELKINEAKRLLSKLTGVQEERIPILLNGASGVGKTSIVRELAQELELPLIDFRLSTETPENVGGIPIPDENPSEEEVIKYFRKITNKNLRPAFEGGAVLFFDELNRSSGWIRNAVMSAFFERMIAGVELNERTIVIGAINTGRSYRDTEKLDYALLARFAIINVKPDFELAHTFVKGRPRDEIDDEFEMLFFGKKMVFETMFYGKNEYTPIEPAYTGRNVEYARAIYRKYRKDSDLERLMKCVLPDNVVDLALAGFDLSKVELLINGNYDFPIEKDEDVLTLVSLALSRKDLTEEQVVNILRFADMYHQKAGMRDAMTGILREFSIRNKEIFNNCLKRIVREFPWVKDLV
jgi:hypothetical protein